MRHAAQLDLSLSGDPVLGASGGASIEFATRPVPAQFDLSLSGDPVWQAQVNL
jgi:hypothetical protein